MSPGRLLAGPAGVALRRGDSSSEPGAEGSFCLKSKGKCHQRLVTAFGSFGVHLQTALPSSPQPSPAREPPRANYNRPHRCGGLVSMDNFC